MFPTFALEIHIIPGTRKELEILKPNTIYQQAEANEGLLSDLAVRSGSEWLTDMFLEIIN